MIHHGVPDVPFVTTGAAKAAIGLAGRTVISTFGLINRGKGLEYAIEAMSTVVRRHPDALYMILGQTHPVVRRYEGEIYREALQQRVVDLGLSNNVALVDRYLEFDELLSYLSATDVYLTPYLNPVQIVSGTLAYAVGCGKAVVSTPYLYAKELLAHSRGMLVRVPRCGRHREIDRLAARRTGAAAGIERRAYRFGRQMTWPHVVAEYGKLFGELVHAPRPSILRVPATRPAPLGLPA